MIQHDTCPKTDQLRQLLDESLSKEDESTLIVHLEGCEACQHTLEGLAAGGPSWEATLRLKDGAGEHTLEPALERAVEELEGGNPGETQAESSPGADDLSFLAPSKKPEHLGRLDHYEVLEVVGRGGMGIVLKAFDEKLHRIVAIKVLAPQLATSATARKRFLREAHAAAAVAHEHVVAIHAIEDSGPIPYLVMQFVAGISLEDRIKKSGPLGVKEVLRIGMQIASGLAAAHAQGLVHRDVKPANVLLENGVERVKLTDFGLARAVDDASLTQSGVIAGTPMYMAPEQARGDAVDHRCDLFSLGSVLYTLGTGRPPFRASTTMAVLKRVSEDAPRPIREVNPDVPDWLAAIVMKLLAKDPAQRFQSAAEVAELLGQHLAHLQQPLLIARPPSIVTSEYPARRRRWRVVLAALVFPVFVAGTVQLAILWWHGKEGNPDSGHIAQETEKDSPFVPRPPLTEAELAKLPSPLDGRKREEIAPELLALAGGEQAPAELVAMLGDARFVLPGQGLTSWMTQSPDGKLLAVPRGSDVVLFDASTGAVVRTLVGPDGRIYNAAFSPDGTRLVGGTFRGAGAVAVWDVQTGRVVHVLKGHTGVIWRTAFSGDGRRLVSASSDKTAKVWDAEKGVELFTLRGHQDEIYTGDFNPDGRWVLTGSKDGTVKVWDALTGQESKTLPGNGLVFTLAYSPDGRLLAGGGTLGWKLWDAKTFEEVRSKNTAAECNWLTFSADSRALLAGRHINTDGTVHAVVRWDVASGDKLGTLALKSAGGYALYALSPDTKTLFATGAEPPDPFVRSYDAETGKELVPHQGHTRAVFSVAVSPNGRTLASGGADHTVRLWDLGNWQAGNAQPPVRLLEQRHTGLVWSVVFSPDGKILASGSYDATIVLWDVASGKEIRTLTGHSKDSSLLAFSPDGRTLAAGQGDGSVQLWEVATGKPQTPLRWHQRVVRAVAFSPDGSLLASAGEDRTVQVVDLATGRRVNSFVTPMILTNVAFTPDGRKVATVTNAPEARVYLWELATKEEVVFAGHTNHVGGLAVHPGGHLAASGALDGTLRFWDLKTGSAQSRLVFGPGPFGNGVWQVAFTPEGRYVVTANDNGTISILKTQQPPKPYDPGPPKTLPDPVELAKRPSAADALKRSDIPADLGDKLPPEVVAVLGGPAFVLPEGDPSWMATDRDGKMLAVPCGDKVVLFDAHTGKLLRTLTGHTGRVYCAAFSPDGKRLAAGNWDDKDHTIRTWNTDTGEPGIGRSAHTGNINAVTYSPDGKRFVSTSSDGTAYLWSEEKDGKHLILKGHDGAVYGAAFSPDGKRVATAGEDKTVRIWDTTTGKEVKSLAGHEQSVMNVAFSPDGKYVASGTEEEWKLWDAITLTEVKTVAAPAGWLAFAPDSKSLLGAGHNNSGNADAPHVVKCWNLEGKELAAFPLKGKGGWAAYALSPDGKTLFEVGIHTEDRTLRTYDAETGTERATQGHSGQVFAVAVSPDGKTAASTAADNTVRLWDLATGQLRHSLTGPQQSHTLAYSLDGKRLASGGYDGLVDLWEPETGKGVGALLGEAAEITQVAFSPDGRLLASAVGNGLVRIWEVSSCTLLLTVRADPIQAACVTFSPDGKTLITGGREGIVRLFDVGSGWEVGSLSVGVGNLRWFGLHPDGVTLAVSGDGGTAVRVWNLATGVEKHRLDGQEGYVTFGGDWRGDGRLLATADGAMLRLWDLGQTPLRRREIRELPLGKILLHDVAFTPEGRHLVTANPDGTVYVLRLAKPGEVYQVPEK